MSSKEKEKNDKDDTSRGINLAAWWVFWFRFFFTLLLFLLFLLLLLLLLCVCCYYVYRALVDDRTGDGCSFTFSDDRARWKGNCKRR